MPRDPKNDYTTRQRHETIVKKLDEIDCNTKKIKENTKPFQYTRYFFLTFILFLLIFIHLLIAFNILVIGESIDNHFKMLYNIFNEGVFLSVVIPSSLFIAVCTHKKVATFMLWNYLAKKSAVRKEKKIKRKKLKKEKN